MPKKTRKLTPRKIRSGQHGPFWMRLAILGEGGKAKQDFFRDDYLFFGGP
jgi:hypothetical protein